jgi:hypothetical protein
MNALNILLERFGATLKEFNPVNFSRLYPPLPSDRITGLLKQFDCEDEDMRILFSWKGGFDPALNANTRCMIFDFRSFLCSLDSMVYLLEDNKTDPRWEGPYLPLLRDDTGQFLIFNNGFGENRGKIHLYSSSLGFINDPISYYDSIPAMIETTLLSYEQEAFIYDDTEDRLKIDRRKYAKIAKEINRKSAYWESVSNRRWN